MGGGCWSRGALNLCVGVVLFGCSTPATRLGGGGWDARVDLTMTGMGESFNDCSDFAWSFDIVDQGDSLEAFVGRDGGLSSTALSRRDATTVLANEVVYTVPNNVCGNQIERVDVPALAVTASDADGDGVADHLRAQGAGKVSFETANSNQVVAGTYDMQYVLTATLDHTAPVLTAPPAGHEPLDPLVIASNEPLKSAAVTLDDLPSARFDAPQNTLALSALTSQAILPFAGDWRLVGSAEDFAGNAAVLGMTVSTLKDPGLFAQDGFEGPLVASFDPSLVQVVDMTSGLVPPAGAHALIIRPFGSVTFHLSRQPGQQTVSATVVELFAGGGNPSQLASSFVSGARAGVVGGSASSFAWAPGPTLQPTATPDFPNATPPTQAQATLVGDGGDVIVRFQPPCETVGSVAPGAPCTASMALLIDDLKLE